MLSADAVQVMHSVNSWWGADAAVRPSPPAYRRPAVVDLAQRFTAPRGLIEILLGPRQVGKTTGMLQLVEHLLARAVVPSNILLIRFDLEVLREEPAGLRRILDWYTNEIRKRPLHDGDPTFLFLDEIHKLRRWNEEVKHVSELYPVRILLTGSSSVLLKRGGQESLAGRTFTTVLPTFSFREILEAWHLDLAERLPPRIRFHDAFRHDTLFDSARRIAQMPDRYQNEIAGQLERYYLRGGYPRLHNGEVDDDRWADYLSETVLENVLGADIPDLFPVESPTLLRAVYLEIARSTGQEIAQNRMAAHFAALGIPATQPTVGKYLRYLASALLVREFSRYPLAKKATASVPTKVTLTDLGVHNAIFRGAPSLWESDPRILGPLVETLTQSVIRDMALQVHFFRDYEVSGNRRTPIREVDFIAERADGTVLPIEVKFRKTIHRDDLEGLRVFAQRFRPSYSVLVTRNKFEWNTRESVLSVPLPSFLLAF